MFTVTISTAGCSLLVCVCVFVGGQMIVLVCVQNWACVLSFFVSPLLETLMCEWEYVALWK